MSLIAHAPARCSTRSSRYATTSDSRHVTGVDDDRVVGRTQRRHRAGGVQVVAALHVGQHRLVVAGEAVGDVLVVAPPRPFLGRRGQEDLHVGIGQHDGADVAALDHDAAGPSASSRCRSTSRVRTSGTAETAETALVTASPRISTETSSPPRKYRSSSGSKPTARSTSDASSADRRGVVEVDTGAQHGQRHDPVHRTGVQVARTQRSRQTP